MPDVKEISAFFDRLYPYESKLDFDNVGLLCGSPDREVKAVLISLDITSEVVEEAHALGAELIVSHHPIIFEPLRTLTDDSGTGRRLSALLRADISAICLHTNLDVAVGGVNAVLAEQIGAEVEGYLPCGCIASLPDPVTAEGFARIVRDSLHAPGVRFLDAGCLVKRIAICGGAGGDLTEEARSLGCDTVLTGELHHHQWIEGQENGLNLVEAGHFETEHPVTAHLAAVLKNEYPSLRVEISEKDRALYRVL